MTAGVRVIGVSRRFGRTEAISDVSFDVEDGEVLGLLGPNGAGKTTTMRVMTGYLRPTSGSVVVAPVEPGRRSGARGIFPLRFAGQPIRPVC